MREEEGRGGEGGIIWASRESRVHGIISYREAVPTLVQIRGEGGGEGKGGGILFTSEERNFFARTPTSKWCLRLPGKSI